MQESQELKGTIDRFLFQSTDTGFSVFVLVNEASKAVTVRGFMSSLQPGQDVSLVGKWVVHPKFGQQFEAASCTPILPTSKYGLEKYLGSGLIKGIGKTYAKRLVDWFGTDIMDVIEHQPDRLKEVAGIGEKRIEEIVTSWHAQKSISRIMIFLQDKGISTAYATKIYKKYGNDAIAIVQQNPYRLADDIWGIGFKVADQIAQKMGIEKYSIARIKSGLIFAITTAVGNGHLYIELEELKKSAYLLLELNLQEHEQYIKNGFHDLYNQEKIKIVTHDNKHYITLSSYYGTEKGVASLLQIVAHTKSPLAIDIDAVYQQLRTNQDIAIELNDNQQRALLTCLQNKVTIITGGPGTGKTTVIKTLLQLLDTNRCTYKLAAPTGRAAKRIIEGTGRHAETIHRLLAFDVSTMKFTHNEENTLTTDFLIIDEASMIDIFLAHAILKAAPRTAHIVFIGDVDQLPSVGAGNFLNDLIQSKIVSCIHLTEIFRQARNSMIIVNAHRVNHGEFPTSTLPEAKRDFLFFKEEDPALVTEHLKKILSSTLKQYHISIENSIVLVPMNKGIVGTQTINKNLQDILNPDTTKKSIERHGITFRVSDRVMQIRNNYEKFVFNGDIGTIHDIDTQEKEVHIQFNERILAYGYDEMDEVMLAYAISIHKSQGSEYDAAIIPIFTQHFALLQRNLIYTAITRAKKLCILIGQPRAIAMAIKNNKQHARKTFLKEFLTTDLQCR